MRARGCMDSAACLGSDGHACWGFGQQEEFVAAAVEFLQDGLRHGQRLAYVGSEPLDLLAAGDGEPTSLNLEALEFIDHHGAEVLARRGCRVRNAPPVVDRLCELLELQL